MTVSLPKINITHICNPVFLQNTSRASALCYEITVFHLISKRSVVLVYALGVCKNTPLDLADPQQWRSQQLNAVFLTTVVISQAIKKCHQTCARKCDDSSLLFVGIMDLRAIAAAQTKLLTSLLVFYKAERFNRP